MSKTCGACGKSKRLRGRFGCHCGDEAVVCGTCGNPPSIECRAHYTETICELRAEVERLKTELALAATLIADGGRKQWARAVGHDERAVQWLDRNGFDMVTGKPEEQP